MSPRKKTKTSKCKTSKKYTGALSLDQMISVAEKREKEKKKDRESKWKKAAKIGLGVAAVGLGAALGYNALKNGGLAAIPKAISAVKESLPKKAKEIKESLPQSFDEIKESIPKKAKEIKESLPQSFDEIKESIPKKAKEIKESLPQSLNEIKDSISNKISSLTGTNSTENEEQSIAQMTTPSTTNNEEQSIAQMTTPTTTNNEEQSIPQINATTNNEEQSIAQMNTSDIDLSKVILPNIAFGQSTDLVDAGNFADVDLKDLPKNIEKNSNPLDLIMKAFDPKNDEINHLVGMLAQEFQVGNPHNIDWDGFSSLLDRMEADIKKKTWFGNNDFADAIKKLRTGIDKHKTYEDVYDQGFDISDTMKELNELLYNALYQYNKSTGNESDFTNFTLIKPSEEEEIIKREREEKIKKIKEQEKRKMDKMIVIANSRKEANPDYDVEKDEVNGIIDKITTQLSTKDPYNVNWKSVKLLINRMNKEIQSKNWFGTKKYDDIIKKLKSNIENIDIIKYNYSQNNEDVSNSLKEISQLLNNYRYNYIKETGHT